MNRKYAHTQAHAVHNIIIVVIYFFSKTDLQSSPNRFGTPRCCYSIGSHCNIIIMTLIHRDFTSYDPLRAMLIHRQTDFRPKIPYMGADLYTHRITPWLGRLWTVDTCPPIIIILYSHTGSCHFSPIFFSSSISFIYVPLIMISFIFYRRRLSFFVFFFVAHLLFAFESNKKISRYIIIHHIDNVYDDNNIIIYNIL